MFVGPFEVLHGYHPRSSLSRDHSRTLTPASSRRGPLRDSTEDRQIGLNMNYSIIFTEISFSPETSILAVTNNPNNSYDNSDYARI